MKLIHVSAHPLHTERKSAMNNDESSALITTERESERVEDNIYKNKTKENNKKKGAEDFI